MMIFMRRSFFIVSILVVLARVAVCSGTPEPEATPDIPALEKAAADGDADAKFLLARALFRGRGVEKDAEKSAVLLREAAALGNAEAMDGLGYLYTLGEGVSKDEAKAVEWFRKGAESGFSKSQLNLGLMLRQGKSIPLSNEESLLWIHKAAEGGLLEAKIVLGRVYFTGDSLQKKDYEKAAPFLRESAAGGDPVCQNMLGVACRDAKGMEKDMVAAEEWFRKAAMSNNRKAQSNLGHLLGPDSPESPNRKEAVKWLLISSDQGEITAKKTLAELSPTVPADLLAAARKEADRFRLLQTVAKKKDGQISESISVPAEVPDKSVSPEE